MTRILLEIYMMAGVVICVALLALLYEPPVPPPAQMNYSKSWTPQAVDTRHDAWPHTLRDE